MLRFVGFAHKCRIMLLTAWAAGPPSMLVSYILQTWYFVVDCNSQMISNLLALCVTIH